MTNAENIVKDIDYLVSIISFSEFCNNFGNNKSMCDGCPLVGAEHGCTKESLKVWLMEEVPDNGIHKR